VYKIKGYVLKVISAVKDSYLMLRFCPKLLDHQDPASSGGMIIYSTISLFFSGKTSTEYVEFSFLLAKCCEKKISTDNAGGKLCESL
jgi:hypothetical protein